MNSKLTAVMIRMILVFVAGSLPAYAGSATDPCSLLTPARVAAVLGTNVGATKVSPLLCKWSMTSQPNNAQSVALVLSTARAFGFAKTPVVSSAKSMPASGIGDDAAYSIAVGIDPGPGTALYVKKGNTYFVVHVYGIPDQAKVMAMEKTLALEVCSHL
jgi:hypothetical protein